MERPVTLDDSTKRQLRFSMFLQLAGFVMFLVAFVVRFLNSGLDVLSIVFFVAMVGTAAAAFFTRRQLR